MDEWDGSLGEVRYRKPTVAENFNDIFFADYWGRVDYTLNSLIGRKSSSSVGSSPFEKTHEKKEAKKIVTLSTLWWQVDMKMSVRFRS